MEYTALIVAAGSGSRCQLGYNKVYYKWENKTVLEHAMHLFMEDKDCKQIVVVSDAFEFYQNTTCGLNGKIVLCEGGNTRQESVYHGLLATMCEYVFVHDGARPFLDKKDLENLKEAMKTSKAACLMVPVKDTIKVVDGGKVKKTLERSSLMAAQTPQAFKTDLLESCMEKAFAQNVLATDDCALVEQFSDEEIVVVEGSYSNIKITTKEDLPIK